MPQEKTGLERTERDQLLLACKNLADFGAEILGRDPPPKRLQAIQRTREDLLVAFADQESESAETYTKPIERFLRELLKEDEYTPEEAEQFKEIIERRGLGNVLQEIADQLEGTSLPALKTAEEYESRPMRFVWYPFLPCGEYSVMAAAGGSGKGMCACLITAYLTSGVPLPEDKPCPDSLRAFPYREPQNVLFVSAEDTGSEIRGRLGVSHADLTRVYILDKDSSTGLDLSTEKGLEHLRRYIAQSKARLVVIDPVQAFIGGETDMNRAAKMRAILSGFSHVAGETDCGILLIAHTNKRPQDTDLNGGVLGSVETINASRSVMMILRDPEDEDPRTSLRLILHTKSNNAALGRSVRFEIAEQSREVNGEKVYEAGGRFTTDNLYSDVTKEVFEEAIRRKVSPQDLLRLKRYEATAYDDLTEALRERAEKLRAEGKKTALYFYDEIPRYMWNEKRPADALKLLQYDLLKEGIAVRGSQQIKRTEQGTEKKGKGFRLTLTK